MLCAQDGSSSDYGPIIDRGRLKALDIETVQSEAPIVIEDHAFTTGAMPRTSIEHVLPNNWVAFGIKDGLGRDSKAYMNHHFTEEELLGNRSRIGIGASKPPASDSEIEAWS